MPKPIFFLLFHAYFSCAIAQKFPLEIAQETFNPSPRDSLMLDLAYETDSSAIVRMLVCKPNASAEYHSLLFRKKLEWEFVGHKIYQPEYSLRIKQKLDALHSAQIDSIIQSPKRNPAFNFTSSEEFRLENLRLELMMASDQEIMDHFMRNRAEFEFMKKQFLKSKKLAYGASCSPREIDTDPLFQKNLRQFLISHVRDKGYDKSEYVEFLIGGSGTSFVGYLYIPYGQDITQIINERFIILQKLDDNWYFYRTL